MNFYAQSILLRGFSSLFARLLAEKGLGERPNKRQTYKRFDIDLAVLAFFTVYLASYIFDLLFGFQNVKFFLTLMDLSLMKLQNGQK